MSADIVKSIVRIVEPVVVAEGLDLVDVEFRRERRGWVLRLYIDREGGVTIDDCSNISRQVSLLIDVNDLIVNPYTLEVSSPGLNRPLKKEEDFIRFKGNLVKLILDDSIDGQRNYKGKLLGLGEGVVRVDVGDRVVYLPFNKIERANLEYQF